MKNKARALKELADEDYKTQIAHKYKNIPNGACVAVIDDNYSNLYGTFCIVKYKGIQYYVKKKDLDFNIKRKIYVLSSNSTDGVEDLRGDYIAVDDVGRVVCKTTCSSKRFAKKDISNLITGYGDFRLLFLGEDNMTLDKLVQLHNDNYNIERRSI